MRKRFCVMAEAMGLCLNKHKACALIGGECSHEDCQRGEPHLDSRESSFILFL